MALITVPVVALLITCDVWHSRDRDVRPHSSRLGSSIVNPSTYIGEAT